MAERRWTHLDSALLGASVLFLAGLVASGLLFATLMSDAMNAHRRSAAPVTLSLRELQLGNCVLRYELHRYVLSDYEVVDCSRAHAAELVHSVDIGDEFNRYPGDRASSDFVADACESAMEFRLHLRDDVVREYPRASLHGVYNSSENWARGDRKIYCFLVNDDGSPLTAGFYKANTFD